MARNRLRTKTLSSLEQLENRTLMSNFVTPVLSNRGTLTIRGDDQDNVFAVQRDGDSIRTTGSGDTAVVGQSVFPMEFVRKLKIEGGRGNDSVYVDEFLSKVRTNGVESTLVAGAFLAGVPAGNGPPSAVAAAQSSRSTGFLKAAYAIDGITIGIQFKKPIAHKLAANLRYEIDGLEVTNVEVAPDRRGATLTTTPQDVTGYVLEVSQVKGSGDRARVVKRATAPVVGSPAPRIIDIKPISDTSILVTYDRPMGPGALDPANYAITRDDGQPLEVTGAEFVGQVASMVEVRTAPQSYTNYTFNVQNVTDSAGQQVFFDGRKFSGNPKASVVSVAATSPTTVVVAFNEPMADNALAPQHYTITSRSGGQALLVTDAQFDGPLGMVVVLTTAPQSAVAYDFSAATNITDLGNEKLVNRTATFTGIAAPALINAIPTQPTRLVLTFTGPVGDSALAPSTYEIAQLAVDENGNEIEVGTLPISGAVFVGGQRTVVELVTLSQADVKYRITTTSALTDVVGSPLPAASATFQGILSSRPTLIGAISSGPTSLLVTYSEPMSDDALSPSSYSILPALRVLSSRFVGTEQRVVELFTDSQGNATVYTVKSTATDLDGNSVPGTSSARFTGIVATDVAGAPRVVGAASLSNTTVIVAFSEPMGDGAQEPSHYVIVQENDNPEAGALLVTKAEYLSDDNHATIKLTTMSQNELTYTLTVVNVRDEQGQPLASPITSHGVLFDPTRASFPGAPYSGPAIIDSDGDGLSDNTEQRGWIVSYVRLDGSIVSRGVTSNPGDPSKDPDDPVNVAARDTDGDGLDDSVEAALALDPRDPDTDDDLLDDNTEFNVVFSNPAATDTDGDGLDDGLEHDFFHTSPLLADTDGDQFPDDLEIILDNRNPLLADLPRVVITTGNVDLRLDVRFDSQTSQGTTTVDSKSVATTLAQSSESSQSNENSSSKEIFMKVGAEACIGGSCEGAAGKVTVFDQKTSLGGKFTAEAGGSGSSASTFTTASSKATQREYATTLSTDQEVSTEAVVNRVVEGATMAVSVNLVNSSNIAFAIRNIEITALIPDPRDPTSFTPVATLFAASDEPVTIGPLNPTRGPFRFSATEAFPELVESLMQNPRSVLFQVANYEIEDEFGRNFSFVEQDINDRTAFFEIDYSGNAPLEKHRVATTSDFDENGKPVGLTMKEVMEDLLGLEFVDEDTDENLDPFVREDAELIDRSYSTRIEEVAVITRDADGNVTQVTEQREVLFRVKGVSSKLTDVDRKWWVWTPQGLATPAAGTPGMDFSDLKVFAGQEFLLKFVKDVDDDALEADTEALWRSIDSEAKTDGIFDSRDTDDDGLDDGDEVYGFFQGNKRVPWTIRPEDGQDAYQTTANPSRADTDLDGLTDTQELGLADITVWRDADGVPTVDLEKVAEAEAMGEPLDVIATFRRGQLEPIPEENRRVFHKDDGDFGFEAKGSGSFGEVVPLNVGFQNDSVFAFTDDLSKPPTATWSFGLLPPGEYRVSATWPSWTLDEATVYTVSVDDGSFTNPVFVNPINLPNDLTDENGVTWEDLGSFTVVQKGRLSVKLSGPRILADAIRLEQIQRYVTFPTDPSNPDSDGDGLTDAEEIAGVRYVTLLGKTSGSDVPETNTLLPDPDQGYATNPLSRDTDNDGFPDKREVQLGTNPTVNDGASVRDDDGDGLVNLQETTGWDVKWTRPDWIMDDGDPGFSADFMTQHTSSGFKGDYHSNDVFGFEEASWQFTNLVPGRYRVSATWPVVEQADRTTFSIDTTIFFSSVPVNQSFPPNDYTYQGAEWEELSASVTVGASGVLLVRARADSLNFTAVADAIRIEAIEFDAANTVLEFPLVEHVAPSRRDPDSDDDGLTDWEEYTGCRDRDHDLECDDVELRTNPEKRWGPTNPNSADTDGDGLTDREEVDGVDFLGDDKTPFRFTDPLDWDSDDDGRSDGDEVNVPWEVKVAGQPIREVYSDPLKADADGDALKDGDEATLGSDPSNPDTDGDEAFDGVEFARAAVCASNAECLSTTSVLVPDRWVTVDFLRLTVGKGTLDDGDKDSGVFQDQGAGDFTFEFGIEIPVVDETGPPTLEKVVVTNQLMVNATGGACGGDPSQGGNSGQDIFKHACRGDRVHRVSENPSIFETLKFMQLREASPINVFQNQSQFTRSRRTFAVPNDAVFALYGNVTEWDFEEFPTFTTIKIGSSFDFGGIGSPDGSFVEIAKGTQSVRFEKSDDGPPIEVQVTIRAE